MAAVSAEFVHLLAIAGRLNGRISGTAHGTVMPHVAQVAATGGPPALVDTGDVISLDAEASRIGRRFPQRNWPGGSRTQPPSRASPAPTVAGNGSASISFSRPTPVRIWTSAWESVSRRSAVSRTDGRAGGLRSTDPALLAQLEKAVPGGVASRASERLSVAHDASR